MKHITIMLALVFLAACAPNPPAQFPSDGQPLATAFIDASYPTAQADVAQPNQTSNGIEIRLDRAWMEGKNLNANVCFTLPDSSDWSVWSASLNYGGAVLQQYGTTLLSFQDSVEGQPGQRCDTLTFVVPPDADLTSASISIDSLAALPRAGDYCSVYLPKIQQALLERGIGITLDCLDVNGELTMQIVSKPPEMSQEEAEQIVYSDEFYSLKGPWIFSLTLTQ